MDKVDPQQGTETPKSNNESSIDALFITNVKEGIGWHLLTCIVSDTRFRPKIIFVGFKEEPTDEDLDVIKRINLLKKVESDVLIKIIFMDTSLDADIIQSYQDIRYELEGKNLELNVLINNCGKVIDSKEGPSFLKEHRDNINKHFNLSVTSSVMVAKAFVPLLQKAKDPGGQRAVIVNLCFQLGPPASLRKTMKCCHYRASRAALSTVTLLMASELRDRNILTVACIPGWSKPEAHNITEEEEEEEIDEDISCMARKLWCTIINLSEDKAGHLINYDGTMMPW